MPHLDVLSVSFRGNTGTGMLICPVMKYWIEYQIDFPNVRHSGSFNPYNFSTFLYFNTEYIFSALHAIFASIKYRYSHFPFTNASGSVELKTLRSFISP